MRIGGDIVDEDDLTMFRNRRVCHLHFEAIYTYPNQRITRLSIPTLHIPGKIKHQICLLNLYKRTYQFDSYAH
jgi:hypothetical protein